MAVSVITKDIVRKSFNIPQTTVSALSYKDIDVSVGLTGYTPAICGWMINGVTTIATVYAGCPDGSTARLRVLNTSSSSQTISSGNIIIMYTPS